MKLVPLAVLAACSTFLPNCALAGSATWNVSPTSNDWSTAANWTPATVPDDPSAIATFDVSNITEISIQDEIDVAEAVFSPGASAFTVIAHYPGLNFHGAGITNNSGVVQTFGAVSGLASEINFYNSATAGEDTTLFQQGSTIEDNTLINFYDTSSAGSATIINYGNLWPNGGTNFYDSSTAANATIFNRPGAGAVTDFSGTSSAGSATIVCETGGSEPGKLNFFGDSTAANATIIVNGAAPRAGGASVVFSPVTGATATAGNATFIINGGTNGGAGGTLSFKYASLGGTAQVTLSGNGTLDLTGHDLGTVSIGSLAGSGSVLLGTTNLSVGTNNFRTEFSGTIQDNAGPPGASLTKTGSGSLALSGANAYDGGTFVGSGTLFVNNVTGSGTGTGTVLVNRGTLGGNGIISGPVRIGDSVSGAARFMPGRTERSPGVLTIANTLTFDSDGSYLWLLNSARGIAASVTAKGATIGSVALFSPRDLQSAPLSAGTVFTVINNTAGRRSSGL